MTKEEKTELEYLIELVLESSKWKIEDGQDAIRLEVESRINSILSHEDQVVTGETEVSPVLTGDDFTTLEAARLNEHLASTEKVDDSRKQWESSKVRCSENGRLVWHPRSECQKVPRDNSKGGPSWKWQWMGPKDKKAQEDVNKLSDELWEAHENGNDL